MTTTTAAHPAGQPSASAPDRFAAARAVADAVLYEGYLLYPYRRSSAKNRVRWQFGVLAPPAWIECAQIPDPGVAGSAESWFQQIDALAEAAQPGTLRVLVRFLQLQRKQVFAGSPGGTAEPVDRLDDAGVCELSFDEALPREYEAAFAVADLLAGECTVDLDVPGARSVAPIRTPGGDEVGQLERTSRPITARLVARAEPASAPFPLLRLRVRLENGVRLDAPDIPRDDALRSSLLAAHLLLALDAGRFLSLLDPPAWATVAHTECANRHAFPVLAGPDEGRDVLLCSPIILYDHPKIAPESAGDLHDASEIDEILTLRTLTLTDDEKAEARATDPRAAAIVDRVDAMPPELLARLHGAIRDLHPLADAALPDSVMVNGTRVGRGSVVRLRPRNSGTDAFDMFVTGRRAHVHEIMHDIDGSIIVAVTVDDDPAAELHEWYGRFFHFSPNEVEPLDDGEQAP